MLQTFVTLRYKTFAASESALAVPVNFVSIFTSYVTLREQEPQTAFPVSNTWASYIAASVLTGH